MISLETASRLKSSGLRWTPEINDYFAVPDRELDEHLFVISDVLVDIEKLGDLQVVAFQGASEWALDYLVTSEVVWMPREDQLREALEDLLIAAGHPVVHLISGLAGYQCEYMRLGVPVAFTASDASEAYAGALLDLLSAQSSIDESPVGGLSPN